MSDYKKTIFLPATSFSMKAGLTDKEPRLMDAWSDRDLYAARRDQNRDGDRFILHAGPPYANGHLHIGHGFNGILKDIVARFQFLRGKDAPLVLGWDCHGLPIEWAIESDLRAQKKDKNDLTPREFRTLCRQFAQKWIDIQREEFRRLGLVADFAHPYVTMDPPAEAAIAKAFLGFVEKGYVYKGVRPVLWSVVEQTALAEAEVEYQDKTSQSIYVRFPITQGGAALGLQGAFALIWTTTPWTLPGNRAVAYGADVTYVVVDAQGDRFVLAQGRLEDVAAVMGWAADDYRILKTITGADLAGVWCRHPLASRHGGYDFEVPLLPGGHVTTDAGTGLVHTAPGHGAEDFEVGKAFGLDIPETVLGDGSFAAHVPLYGGFHVYKVDGQIIEDLKESGTLVHHAPIVHSYPHSWRSKAPLIFRTTPQWFIRVDGSLRSRALDAIQTVRWLPDQGQNRITSMIAGRGDWCVSRQRRWGVPLPLFVHRETGAILVDEAVNQRIILAFETHGSDCWYEMDPAVFLGAHYQPSDYTQVYDILDVWFESGVSQDYVLKARSDLAYPAQMYLEGSDQHRGWFQSSLLVGCALHDRAPFETVLTHGFTVDGNGRKMSKSLGNTVSPESIWTTLGAEILRLWVVSCDYTDDLRIGPMLLKRQEDIYRRYRNTLRYLLGALSGFDGADRVPYDDLPELERYILSLLKKQEDNLAVSLENHDYQGFYSALHTFCASDLSAFYFDVRKDALYCDGADSALRRGVLTVFSDLFAYLVRFLSPVLCFTAEEAYQARQTDLKTRGDGAGGAADPLADFCGGLGESVHLQTLDPMPLVWSDDALLVRWDKIRSERRVMTGALEAARASGQIGSSLQADLTLYHDGRLSRDVDWADLAIVSNVRIHDQGGGRVEAGVVTIGADDQVGDPVSLFTLNDVPHLAVAVHRSGGDKCERCWKVLPEVGDNPLSLPLCLRCYPIGKGAAIPANDPIDVQDDCDGGTVHG